MPTQLTRQAVTSSRHQDAKSIDQSRRREMVCNLLTQIYRLAERTRAAKSSSRRQASSADRDEDLETEDSISLIELIQASYSVFERYGIGPPDDAVYHRYLLSLSINPERDWRKKILNFDLGSQPRVKRLCWAAGHRHGSASKTANEHTDTKNVKVPVVAVDSVSHTLDDQRRRRSDSKQSLVRRASLLSESSTPTRTYDSHFGSKHQQLDHFGDMLSLDSPIQRIPVENDKRRRRAFKAAVVMSKTLQNPIVNDYKVPTSLASAPNIVNSDAEDQRQSSNGDISFSSAGRASGKRIERMAAGERQLQMITTSIEQWRATQAVKQLVIQDKLQDHNSRQQQLILPLCIRAVFHWVTMCLPEKIDFRTTESPRTLPLCVLRRISVDVIVLKQSAKRVWVWQMKTLMQEWRQDARATKAFRVRMIIKQRAAVLETAFQCIQHWRLFTETRKCSADREQWIAQRCSRSRLRICLHHWHEAFQSRQQQHLIDKHHTSRVKQKVLQSWQSAIESKRDERHRYELARKRRIFYRWEHEKERKQTSRALLCVSSDQRRVRLLSYSWNRLRANAVQNQVMRTKMDLWGAASKQHRQRQAFSLWKVAIDQSKDFRERHDRFRRYCRRRHVCRTFAAWASWTERQITMHKVLSTIADARDNRNILICFTSWKKYHEEASHEENILVAQVIQTRRRRIWDQWQKSTGTRSVTRCLDSAYSFHLLSKIFQRWQQHAVKKAGMHFAYLQCQNLHKLSVLALHWRMLVTNMNTQHNKQLAAEKFRREKTIKVKQLCIQGWWRHLDGQRACRLRGEQLEKSIRRHGLMALSWTTWRQAFWLKYVSRLADDQLCTYRKSHTFRLWKQFVRGAHQRRGRALKVVEMLWSFHLNSCFRQWRELVIFKRQQVAYSKLVQQRILRNTGSRHWKVWRYRLQIKREQQEKLSAAASRWQNRQLYAFFHSWKTTWSIRKRHRHLLRATLLTSTQRVLETHFHAWKQRWHATSAREHMLLEMQDKLIHFKIKRAVRWWNATRLEQHKRSCLLVKSLALWRQTLLSSTFRRLQLFQQTRKQKKCQVRQAHTYYRKHLLQSIFSSWSKWWCHRDRIARMLYTTNHQIDKLKMKQTIQRLKVNAHSRKQLRMAHVCVVAMSTGNTKLACLSRWKAFIIQKRNDNRKFASRSVSMKTFRVRRKVKRWKEYVRARRLMKQTLILAVTTSTASHLHQHFNNWKRFVARQLFMRTLKKKAAAYRYFCLLPLHFGAWKAFLASRQHKQTLLLRAHGLWCHQQESRAFKAWVQLATANRQSKRAVAKRRNQTISRCFASWKRFGLLQKKLQREKVRAVNFYEQRIYHRTLTAWRMNTRHDRLGRYCAQLWNQNTSRRSFDTWARHVRLLRSSRGFLGKMRHRTLARVFTAWKLSIKRKAQQLQEIHERFALLWLKDTRAATFSRWKQYAHLRGFIRKKLQVQRERLLLDIVTGWRRIIAARQRLRQIALVVADRSKCMRLSTTVSEWHGKARVLCCVRAMSKKMSAKRVTANLRQRLHRWKQFTLLSLAVKQLVGRRDIELMRVAFVDGFQRHLQLKCKERDLIKRISCVHEAFLKEWLARKLHQRMAVIAASEEIRRCGNSNRLLTTTWEGWMSFHSKKQTQQAAICHLRVLISRLEDRNSPLDAITLAGILRRWHKFQVVRWFERWSDVVQAQQQARTYTLKAIEWWHKTQCRRHFQGWAGFCQQQRKHRQLRAMNSRSKLKRSWAFWKIFKTASMSKKAINQGACRLHTKHVYKSSFHTWRSAAISLRSRREHILELYYSSRLRLLSVLVAEWRKFAAMEKTDRTQKTVARVVYEEKIVKKSFTSWRTNVADICHHRRQLQINTERLQVLLLCSTFRAWNSWSRQHKKLRTVLEVLSNKCNLKVASRVLTAWCLHVENSAGQRQQASSFLRFRRMQKGLRALRSLAQEREYLRTIRQKAQLFRSALSGNHVAIIFTQWRKLAALSRKMRAVTLHYLQNKLLPAAWEAWVAYARTRQALRDKTLAATLCWKNAFIRRAWNALVLAHRVEKEGHAMLDRADLQHRNHRLRKTVSQWRQSSKENQHLRVVCGNILNRWRMQTAYRCFCALHDHAVYRKTLRASETFVRTKVRASVLLRSWYAWRKLILIMRSGKQRMLQRYWMLWRYYQKSRKVLNGFQDQIQAKVSRSSQRRYFSNWKQFIATRKIEKAMVLMSTAFAGTQLMRRTWLCWMRYVAHTRTAKSQMKNALTHMRFQCQFKAFRALQAHSLHQKCKTHANERVQAFRSQRLQACHFVEWRASVVRRISRRQILAQYLNVMQHSLQKKSFSGWSMFAAQRKTLRLKMSQALALRTQMCSRMVFQAWKSFVTKAQKNRIAQGFSAAKTTEHAMKHWKQYVVLCKIERMIGTSELRQVESSFLSWRKVVAVTHQIRAFRAKSARRHWIELVGRVFKSWKDRTQTHAHCRKLLTSVAVGNHLRFRFMLWQRFTLHRKRLAKLLLVVAEPPALLPVDNVESKREGLTLEDMNQTALEGELTSVEGIDSELVTREEIQDLHATSDDDGLVSLGYALARKARVLQRFEVTWDLPQAWHRWRQVFHAQLFYRMRRLQLHFICWQRFAYQQRRNRWIVIRLTNQRQSASVQTIFRAWAELVARVKQLQKDRLREREVWVLVTTEMARRERRQLKAHWHAWKFHVEEARHLQSSLDAYHRARLLTKHWLVWRHDFRQIMSEARRETQRVETHMQEFHLRRALRSFIYYQQRSKRARLVLEYFGNRHYDTVLPEVLSRWRQWTQRQKELAYCLATARMNRLRRHYTAWKVLRNTRKCQRVMVNSLQSKSVEQQRRNVWVRWRRYVKSQIVKDQALQKAIIFHVRKRLQKRWLHYTERVVQLRDHAESAHIQLCAFRGHRAVRRWLAYIKTQRLRRLYQRFVLRKHVQLWQSAVKYAMATRFDDFLLRSKVKKMLVAWQRVAAKHQYWRQICAFFVDKKELQTVRRIFLRWRQLVNARQGKRMATLHAEHSLLQRIWRDWNRATLASQLRRHELMEQAAKHEALMLLRQSLATWQYAVKKQRERRFVLLSCVVKLKSVAAQRMQEVVFRAWRRVVEHECRCSVALVKRDSKSAKRALCFWSAWIRDRQRSRQQLQSAAGYHSQRLKSCVFFYWQTYALAWNDAAKPIVRRHARQLSLPAKVAAELRSTNDGKDSDDSDEDIRRPTSPVVKRLRQRKTNRTRAAEDVAGSSDTVPLAEAVEISMDVKKRLLLLGKWKPQRNGTNRSFTSS